jgi:dihydrofolate reductase
MDPQPQWTAIAAMAQNRVIGVDGKIPWHSQEDFRWFKETTMGGILLMGRKTFASIGRPLPGRETWVLSRSSLKIAGVRTFKDLSEVVAASGQSGQKLFVAGGAEIYQLALPYCREILLTVFPFSVDGDTIFPEIIDRFSLEKVLRKTDEFRIEQWIRQPAALF